MVEFWQTLQQALAGFQFLRPGWLLAFPVALAIPLLLRRRRHDSRWEAFIDPPLLKALLHKPQRRRGLTPNRLALATTVVWILALAGPSWRVLPSPLVEDQAPLVIAISLSPSMLRNDVQPSRLARAKLKVSQLLKTRRGAPTALIAYSGSAHVVLPLTEDSQILSFYLEQLEPDVMPHPGLDTTAALRLAGDILAGQALPGMILLVADSVEALADNPLPQDQSVHLWWVSPPATFGDPAEETAVTAFCQRKNASLIQLTADEADVLRIQRRVKHTFAARHETDSPPQYEDAGYYLLLPLAFLLMVWFRKGMVLQ